MTLALKSTKKLGRRLTKKGPFKVSSNESNNEHVRVIMKIL